METLVDSFNVFISLYFQTCTAGLCSYCYSWGNRFRTQRWSWWTGPSQTSLFRTMSSCEWLACGSFLSSSSPAAAPVGLLWGMEVERTERQMACGHPCGAVLSLRPPSPYALLSLHLSPSSLFCLCSAEAGPDFELRLELYGACVEEEGALAGAPKRLATKLSSSLGRSSGKRVRASLDSAGGSGNSPILLPTPAVG